jgi:signal transduction histidine kinase/ligand-binding sensor domain-containing protein/CheY-like chemotaxis protein
LFSIPPSLAALDPARPVTGYKVEVWNRESGLPSNSVYAIQQTRDGYLWLGTGGGLVRFDGVRFQVYDRTRTHGLESDVIRALCEDGKGTLWIGTDSGGLTRHKEGKFITYPAVKYPALRRISSLNLDRRGNVWIGSFINGLTCFNGDEFTTYTTEEGLPHNHVRSIRKDAKGDLFAVTAAGIIKIIGPGRFEVYAPDTLLPYLKTACLYLENEGELWVGTGANGLFRLRDGKITAYGTKEGLHNLTINSLFEDRSKNLWIGTDGGGLTRLSNGKMTTLSGRDYLADGSILSIYEDREGSLWVGTLDGGLLQLKDNIFSTYTTNEGLGHNNTNCVYEDRAGDILIGTSGGLTRFKNGTFVSRLTTGEGLLDDEVSCLSEDAAGTLRIGTWGGLHTLKNGQLTPITQKDGLTDNRITCVMEDRQGNTWVGTANGLNRFDGHTGAITRFTTNDGLPAARIEFIVEESKGRILICTGVKLNYLQAGKITPIVLPRIEAGAFHCAYQDKAGVSWIGTDSGLIRFKDGKSFLYTVSNGLVENHVYSVLEDSRGYLWLGGRGGISRVLKKDLEDVALKKVDQVFAELYDEKDGMQSGWCTGDGYRTRDGRLWFPTLAGAAAIDPNRIETKAPPPPVIEKCVADGETFNIHATPGKKAHLPLGTGKKRLEFYYTGVSFGNPRKIRFKIKLEGYDSDWIDMNIVRSTTYTGLQPGNYTFRVTTGNTAGTGKDEASFSFYLKPYFYQTTWFFVSVALLILMFVFSFHRYRLRQLRTRKEELKRLVQLRTRDLEQSKELIEAKSRQLEQQSEQLKELDEAKSRFFANISHEFRSPLTLINGPLEQILSENPDNELESRANMMLRNSRRLLNLVDQLLELAKFDSGKMILHAARQNIVPFIKTIVMCFESLALQNEVEFDFQAEADEIFLYFDPEKMDRIISNLLSNAFNYTDEGGKVTVSIKNLEGRVYPSGCVEIQVRDTGTGIPEEQLPHIFDRFYRGEDSHGFKRKGTGIGLALVKELVELHHGEIKVRSSCSRDNNRGTEFTIRLPMGDDHLQPHEISEIQFDPQQAPSFYIPSFEESKDSDGIDEEQQDEKNIILVVDDNADVRTYIRGALEPIFNVTEAANGKEGIQKAQQIIPDLVISDIMMPEIDGYQLCVRLKKDIETSHIPIILLTAKASEDSMAEGLETGADDYITKPFNIDLLVIRVKNLIRLRRQLQQKIQRDIMLQSEEVSVSSIDNEFIKELQAIIEKNLSDPDFNVEQLGANLYMSPTSLRRKVEALTGESPIRLLRSYRLSRAAQLLKANFGNVTEVAFAVGFSSTAYFTKCFKEKYNQLPHNFKNG